MSLYGDKHDMAIPDNALVEISLRMVNFEQQCMCVFQYQIGGIMSPPTAENLGEAWWNHVKTTTRLLVPTGFTAAFRSVLVRELNNPAGAMGEFPIPPAERSGTRAPGTPPDAAPTFNAYGVRLTVGSRATRPGQKRFPFVTEADILGNVVNASMVTALENWGAIISAEMVLGAPVAAGTLQPIVCRKDAAGDVLVYQDVTGYIVNTNVTSQVSRKVGRGS